MGTLPHLQENTKSMWDLVVLFTPDIHGDHGTVSGVMRGDHETPRVRRSTASIRQLSTGVTSEWEESLLWMGWQKRRNEVPAALALSQ